MADKKNIMRHRDYPWSRLIVFLIVTAVLVHLVSRMTDDNPDKEQRVLGIPIITNTYTPLERHSIDQIVECDKYVYILYGDHAGNVQVFDRDGGYQYSASFYTHLNGAFSIAADQGVLYVRDEHYNVYTLQNGELISFYTRESAGSILEMIDFDESSVNYYVRFGSVWKNGDDGDVCVIKRPMVSLLYQNDFIFYASLLSMLITGLIYRLSKRKS